MAQSLFEAKNNMDVVQHVRERQAPTLITLRNEIPEELSDLVHDLLEKDPDKRPSNSQEVLERLEQIVYAQGLFDGHKRILAQLARQYPRDISFEHVPSGGETQKVTANETNQSENVVLKQIPEVAQTLPMQVTPSNSKGLFLMGLVIMALLGVLIGLNLTTSEDKVKTVQTPPAEVMPTTSTPVPQPVKVLKSTPTSKSKVVQKAKPKTKSTAKAKKTPVATGFGSFQLTSSPWGWVEIDGRKLKKHTPIRDLQLSSGEHQIRVFNPELELERVFKINVRANEKLRKKVNLSTGTIR